MLPIVSWRCQTKCWWNNLDSHAWVVHLFISWEVDSLYAYSNLNFCFDLWNFENLEIELCGYFAHYFCSILLPECLRAFIKVTTSTGICIKSRKFWRHLKTKVELIYHLELRRIKLDFREHYILHIFLHGLKPLHMILQIIRVLRKLIEVHEQKRVIITV